MRHSGDVELSPDGCNVECSMQSNLRQLMCRGLLMPSKGQMTGMLGVYLVAAKLSKLGFIVSPTSRSAAGADLLVTDQACRKAWSVQVKANGNRANFWLMGAHTKKLKSDSHVYVFVNNARGEKPEYLVARSNYVADKICHQVNSNSEWYSFRIADRPTEDEEGWGIFGNPNPSPEIAAGLQAESQAEMQSDLASE